MFKKTRRKIRKSKRDMKANIRKNQYLCIFMIALLFGVGMFAMGGGFGTQTPFSETTTTTTTTTTDTTTTDTTTTTTTTEPAVIKYIFKAQWQLTAPEADPDWVLIEFNGNVSYKDGVYMFNEDTWYNGAFLYEFERDEGSMIEVRSSTGWLLGGDYAGQMEFVNTGPWSQDFDIYNHVGGSVIGFLFVSWEEV